MKNTIPSPSDDQWVNLYEQPTDGSSFVAVAAAATATATGVVSSNSSPNSSCNDHQLSPPPKGSPSKPIRRRSRASKKTPTTLLNADANNFRALVQQFTGCPSNPISFGTQKGPVNLNFAEGRQQNPQAFGNNFHYYQQSQSQSQSHHQLSQQQQQLLLQQQSHQQQLGQQERQNMYPFDNINATNDVFLSTTSSNNSTRPNMEIMGGFALGDDVSNLHQLTMDSFSRDHHHRSDGYFF